MDYSQVYGKISGVWRHIPNGTALLQGLDSVLVAVVAGAYGVSCVWLVASGDDRIVRVVAVPALVLVAVSVLRAALNRPRPYESFDIDPILKATTQGKSMPSRHAASAFAIACALGYVNAAWGVAAAVAACLVAYARVAGGLHFPRDVIAGAVLTLACGFVGYVLL